MTRSGSGVAGLAALRTAGQVLACAGMAAALLVAVISACGWAAPFSEAPPTSALYRATAYTLRGGEWQIGIPSILAPLAISVEYGVTSSIQIGTMPLLLAFGQVYFGGKLRLPLGDGFDMAVPLSVGPYPDPIGFTWGTGAVLSLRLGGGFTFHGGVGLGMVQNFYILPYAIADFDLLPNLKVVGEFWLIPLNVVIATWIRVLPFLDVKLALTPLDLSFTGGVYLRLWESGRQ